MSVTSVWSTKPSRPLSEWMSEQNAVKYPNTRLIRTSLLAPFVRMVTVRFSTAWSHESDICSKFS